MQSFSTKEKISRLISKIQIDWDRANLNKLVVSRIDKDILTDDIKKLYDLVYELDIANADQEKSTAEESFGVDAGIANKDHIIMPENQQQQSTEDRINDIADAEDEKETQLENQIDDPAAYVNGPVETTAGQQEQNHTEITQPPVELETTDERVLKEQKQKDSVQPEQNDLKAEPKVTLDLFSASKTLSDIYQDDNDNSLAAKIQQNKIADIRTAIGINDKFLFINEIFKGEMSSYNQAIDELNNTSNFHEAAAYIDKLKASNANEENKASFNKLFEIAKRRFH